MFGAMAFGHYDSEFVYACYHRSHGSMTRDDIEEHLRVPAYIADEPVCSDNVVI